MGAAPVTEIHGHDAKICKSTTFHLLSILTLERPADGIDWSRRDSKKLVTCSLDKSFKVSSAALGSSF